MEEKMIHLFENAGLGKAPFRFIGVFKLPSKAVADHNPLAYQTQMEAIPPGWGMGSCHYCGTGLTYNYMIESADGQKFVVGSECVRHTGDAGLIRAVEVEERRKRGEKADAKAKVLRDAAQIERDKLELEQRERNDSFGYGHQTDAEVIYGIATKHTALKRVIMSEAIETLRTHRNSNFCLSIADDIERGNLPRGRGRYIMLDILAKHAGRRGSSAYDAEYDRWESHVYSFEETSDMHRKELMEFRNRGK